MKKANCGRIKIEFSPERIDVEVDKKLTVYTHDHPLSFSRVACSLVESKIDRSALKVDFELNENFFFALPFSNLLAATVKGSEVISEQELE